MTQNKDTDETLDDQYESYINLFIRGTITREKTKGTRRSWKMKERNK